MRIVQLLDAPGTDNAEIFGAKTATLSLLSNAGFPVPRGVALGRGTTMLSPAEGAELTRAVATLPVGPLAVRSSSTLEDQANESAAGRFLTVLNVRGDAAIITAVSQVLASGPLGSMAVLVQEMVPAVASGVAFTVNPVSGAAETLVNAVHGLGDRLVSGILTPDEWTIPDSLATAPLPAVPYGLRNTSVLNALQLSSVVALARAVAVELGTPQDIEWAILGDQVNLLQARPITTLTDLEPIPVIIPPGFWERDVTHSRAPRTTLTCSFLDENTAVAAMSERFGLLATLKGQDIGGWMYMGLEIIGAPPSRPGRSPAPPPPWLLPLLLWLNPQSRRRMRLARAAMRSDLASTVIDRWDAGLPALNERIGRLRDLDLAGLGDSRLAEHLDATRVLLEDGLHTHFLLAAPYMLATAEICFLCRELLDWDEQQSLELLVGTSFMSSEPARELSKLADMDEHDPDYGATLAHFQRVYGCRALGLELAEPTLAESPAFALNSLRQQRAHGYDPRQEAADLATRRAAQRQRAHDSLSPSAVPRFDSALKRAIRAYPLRETNVFYNVDTPVALARYAALEAARRLHRRSQLEKEHDVFHCTVQELRQALTNISFDLRPIARSRRAQHAWAIAHPGPASYGTPPGPPPSFARLKFEVRHPTESLAWIGQQIMGAPTTRRADTPDSMLRGAAASSGTYLGPARIILSETELGRVQPGDVLVCPGTRPSWSVIFPLLGAIVTDGGGTLSHPAIIAREHRIPAVVATGDATTRIREGQIVRVDGDSGLVTLHPFD